MNAESAELCQGCGLAVAGRDVGCQAIMDKLLALHFSEPLYFGTHRLFVDAYCLQHPARYCVSFKSFAAHIAHLCWSLEYGGSRAIPNQRIRRWLERQPHVVKPEIPAFRGKLTIELVARAADPAAHHRAVDEWARSTWEAYGGLQKTARHWVNFALHRAS